VDCDSEQVIPAQLLPDNKAATEHSRLIIDFYSEFAERTDCHSVLKMTKIHRAAFYLFRVTTKPCHHVETPHKIPGTDSLTLQSAPLKLTAAQ
jgi:hypothetical protein